VTRAAADEMATRSFSPESDIRIPGLEVPYDLGNYVLEEEIGRGGMGIVYRATRKADGVAIAIKMINVDRKTRQWPASCSYCRRHHG